MTENIEEMLKKLHDALENDGSIEEVKDLCNQILILDPENPNAKIEKELLLFRDSFGSSLAPLLIENYKKITLIDIRYMSSKLIGEFIEFDNQDVLFLYSTVVLNQNIFK